MRVDIGNATAIEGYRENGAEDGPVLYKRAEGQRTTTLILPDDLGLIAAVQTVAGTLTAHMEAGSKPVWIESDNASLQALLCEHYGVSPTSARPMSWGSNIDEPKKVSAKKTTKKAAAPAPEPEPEQEG